MTNAAKPRSERHVRGASVIEVVKILRKIRKAGPLPSLSGAAQELLDTQILFSQWYPFEPFEELLKIVYVLVFKRSEQYALEMSIKTGTKQFQGPHKGFISKGDPQNSVLALRRTWPIHYDFGELNTAAESDHSVVLTLTGFNDITPVQAMTNTGFAVAAARLAGARNASGEVFEKPWIGAPHLRYRVRF
jgi:hypothetical protein